MKIDMLYVTALDVNGDLVKAYDALKGTKYFCPICKNELVLKKSGNSGKGSRRPHFAHHAVSPNCTPEGVLHYSFKILALERLKYHIINCIPFVIEWTCGKCKKTENANITAGAVNVISEIILKDEQYLCRPDLSLINNANKAYAIIEIVVTHEPEEKVINFCNKHGIALIQVNLTTEDDLDDIDKKLKFPSSVSVCVSTKPMPVRSPINPMAIDPRILRYILSGGNNYGNSNISQNRPYHGGRPYRPYQKKSGSLKKRSR